MRVRVLGPAQVIGPDGSVARLERKARELLTILALRSPKAVSSDELATMLWDDPPESATKTLQAHLSRLRTALSDTDAIVRAGATYSLRVPEADLDVVVVARRREAAREWRNAGDHDAAAAALFEARALWRGDLELPPTVAALAFSTQWAQQRRALTIEHLAALIDGTHPSDALPDLHAATAEDPLDERLWELFVLALHRCGRQADALRAFQDARIALADAGLDPGPALRAAEAAVLAAPGRRRVAPVRYARRGRANVAYLETDDAPTDLLLLNPGAVSIDSIGDEPHLAAAVDRLAASARVIALDRSGIGLSDPVPTEDTSDLISHWVADALAVLDGAGVERPVVMANSDAGLVAISLAAAHPDRVRALVLVHAYPRYVRSEDYPYGIDGDTARSTTSDVLDPDPERTGFDPLSHLAPSVATDPAFRAWWNASGRRAASPATAAALHALVHDADVRALLPDVKVPVLLAHRRSCASCDAGHARHLAEHLPDARLAWLPGADELWFTGDVDVLLDEVETFVAGLP
jgi:DNA-binding SARP family transcriptional activator/pimeloyl-ACP methyl ester carboxylesterase